MKRLRILPCLVPGLALAAVSLPAAPLKLAVDPDQSHVTFDARVNIGIDSFTGVVDRWALDLTMPGKGELPDKAVFTCDVLAMQTGKDKRDEKMREWLDQDTFSTVRFEMTAIRPTAQGAEADGNLTIHGKTQPVTIPLTIARKDASLMVTGEVTVDYRNFDLKVVRMAGFVTVKPEVKVAFIVTGTLE